MKWLIIFSHYSPNIKFKTLYIFCEPDVFFKRIWRKTLCNHIWSYKQSNLPKIKSYLSCRKCKNIVLSYRMSQCVKNGNLVSYSKVSNQRGVTKCQSNIIIWYSIILILMAWTFSSVYTYQIYPSCIGQGVCSITSFQRYDTLFLKANSYI